MTNSNLPETASFAARLTELCEGPWVPQSRCAQHRRDVTMGSIRAKGRCHGTQGWRLSLLPE